jgi:excisionase family DNA binding protein
LAEEIIIPPKGNIQLNSMKELFVDISASADVDFEPLLNAAEAAQLLRCHEKTVQALARAGTIPCLRFGKYWRFRKSSLDAWVAAQIESDHQSRRVS